MHHFQFKKEILLEKQQDFPILILVTLHQQRHLTDIPPPKDKKQTLLNAE